MRALVTGASGGIGHELAVVLARAGHDLILVARQRDRLEEIAGNLRRTYSVAVEVLVCDLSLTGSSGRVHAEVLRRGLSVDVLVNNAGFGDWGYFAGADPGKQAAMIDLNVSALTQLTRLFLPDMIKRRHGRILNVASIAAFLPGPMMSVYFATKAYVLSFSCALAHELEDKGVTVTCLCPGPTASGFQAAAGTTDLRVHSRAGMAEVKDVAAYGYRALMRGQRVAVFGWVNSLMVFCVRFFPLRPVMHAVAYFQSKEKA